VRPVLDLTSSRASLTRWASPPDRVAKAAEFHVVQAHVVQGLQLVGDVVDVFEMRKGILDVHFQDFRNRFFP